MVLNASDVCENVITFEVQCVDPHFFKSGFTGGSTSAQCVEIGELVVGEGAAASAD